MNSQVVQAQRMNCREEKKLFLSLKWSSCPFLLCIAFWDSNVYLLYIQRSIESSKPQHTVHVKAQCSDWLSGFGRNSDDYRVELSPKLMLCSFNSETVQQLRFWETFDCEHAAQENLTTTGMTSESVPSSSSSLLPVWSGDCVWLGDVGRQGSKKVIVLTCVCKLS